MSITSKTTVKDFVHKIELSASVSLIGFPRDGMNFSYFTMMCLGVFILLGIRSASGN